MLQDCFVDYQRSDCAGRMVLVEGLMHLLETLRQRELCVKATCQAIADAGESKRGARWYPAAASSAGHGMAGFAGCKTPLQAPLPDTCPACPPALPSPLSSAVATLAEELHETSDLLSEVLDALQGSSVQQLPAVDRRIGAYWYSAEERGRGVGMVYSRLEANYSVSGDRSQPAGRQAGNCCSQLLGLSHTHSRLQAAGC